MPLGKIDKVEKVPYTRAQKIRNLFKKIPPILPIATLLLFIVFAQTLFKQQQEIRQQADTGTKGSIWKNKKALEAKGLVKKAGEILQVDLIYNEDVNPSLEIKEISKKVGYAKRLKERDGYKLIAINSSGKVLFKTFFKIENKISSPPPLSGEKPSKPIILKKYNFSLTIPYKSDYQKLKIFNPQGKLLVESKDISISSFSGSEDFKMQSDKNLNSKKKISDETLTTSGTELLLGVNVPLPNTLLGADNKLDLVIISDSSSYASDSAALFQSDVARFTNHLLTFKPFSERSSDIVFHAVWNREDLGCFYFVGTHYICDGQKVTTQVNNAGVPHDKIMIIYQSTKGGGDGAAWGDKFATTYNGEYGADVFVHELGHSIGGLEDEYEYDQKGWIEDYVSRGNCWLSENPPAPPWNQLVSLSEYHKGCTFSNWYRSSENSIMRSLDAKYFNKVSQTIINYKLDSYTLSPTSISGTVFIDLNKDGVKQNNELGYNNAQINRTRVALSTGEYFLVRDDGSFRFDYLVYANARYILTLIPPKGYVPTKTDTEVFTATENMVVDLGIMPNPPSTPTPTLRTTTTMPPPLPPPTTTTTRRTTITTRPVASDRCTATGGKKINIVTQACSGSISNYYPNDSWNIKCCRGTVTAKKSLDRCALAGGQKVNISTQYCSGSILNNYYPNDPWDIKCCRGNIAEKPSTCAQRYSGAVCQYDSNPCKVSYLTGLCPGGTRIRCCRSPL